MKLKRSIDLQKPVFEFFEEGDWMRVVVPGQVDRFLKKEDAKKILVTIKQLSVSQKNDLIIIP